MKTISKIIQVITFSIILVSVLSCSNFMKNKNTEKSYITLRLVDIGRTVLPEIDSLSNFVLKGKKVEGTEKTLGIWNTVDEMQSTMLPISTGEWTFTLTAKAGVVDGTKLSGLTEKQIVLGVNTLNFVLSISDDGAGDENSIGSFNITLNYADAENADKVSYALATLENVNNNNSIVTGFNSKRLNPSSNSNTVIFDGDDIQVGTYRARVKFYAASNQTGVADFEIASYRELVQISSGLTSSATRKIESFDNLYTITYHLNGGSLNAGAIQQETFTRKSNVTLPILEKTGYAFNGWYTDSNFTTGNEISTVSNITTNLDVYAKFTPIEYSITYNLNGGTNPTSAKTIYTIESNTITLPTPQRDNYVFIGWFEREDFSGTSKTQIAKRSHGDKTYYAKWLKECTIRFVTAHGVAPETRIVLDGYTLTSDILQSLTKNGWTFGGWYTETSYDTDKKVSDGQVVTDDLTLYAKWEINDDFVFVEGRTIEGNDRYNRNHTESSIGSFIGAFPAGRTVTLNSFYISDHELTQGEYEQYCCYTSSIPSSSYGVGRDYPAYYVSWYDAIVYCNLKSIAEELTPCYALSGETDPRTWEGVKTINGKYSCSYTNYSIWDSITCDMTANGYRLPTDAEWEYAARGGQKTYGTDEFAYYFAGAETTDIYAQSNNALNRVGWYKSNSEDKNHVVKTKECNALGLYDMSGNVFEWCWDWYSDSVSIGNVFDPCGGSSIYYRLNRGGGWDFDATYSCVSRRGRNEPYWRGYSNGFRLVRSAETGVYTINYVTAHGNVPESTRARNFLTSNNLPCLTADGWIFRGWYIDNSYDTDKRAKTGQLIENNLTLYAKWKECKSSNDGFVFVEGGTVVGDNSYNQRFIGAFPEGRTVTLSSFYISDHELTQGEYEQYCCYTSNTPRDNLGAGINYPAYYVSWYDAIVYSNLKSMAEELTPCYSLSGETDPKKWTGIKTSNGKYSCSYTSSSYNSTWNSITCNMSANGYRLPTEAEWEYAARGGQETYGTDEFTYYFAGETTTYYYSKTNSELNLVAWYLDNSYVKIHEVKQKVPNELGLYDMNGNVEEWCWDRYSSSVGTGSVIDPCGDSSSSDSRRLKRGGSWHSDAYFCSVSYRDGYLPDRRDYLYGFRLVRSAE